MPYHVCKLLRKYVIFFGLITAYKTKYLPLQIFYFPLYIFWLVVFLKLSAICVLGTIVEIYVS